VKENVSQYYGRPILKEPVWQPTIAAYLFAGGLTGAASTVAFLCRLTGRERLAQRLVLLAASGAVVNPALLIEDLGRPDRFYNMLRVFKPTSPMSVGSWILAAWGGASATAALSALTGRLRPLGLVSEAGAAVGGLGMATYTGALLAQTSVPGWHRPRRALPFLFASGAATSAAAAALVLGPPEETAPALRLALAGAAAELGLATVVSRSAGDHADAFHTGKAEAYSLTAKALTAAGAATLAAFGRRRPGAVAGGLLTLAGALAARFTIFEAGRNSARLT
jgi:formate-dependent nitrite reductase membrane component NrfD